MDFVHDQLATGRKLRVLTVVDTFSRYVPVLDARYSYHGEDVITMLDRVCCKMGYPQMIRVCSAPRELDRLKLEFLANLSWLGEERRTMKASRFAEARDRRLS